MKVFIALVCLVTVVVSQKDPEPTPIIDNPSSTEPPTTIAVSTSNDPSSAEPSTTTTAASPSDDPTPPQPPTTTPDDSSDPDLIDPVDCDISDDVSQNETLLLPDPKSCESFYACSDGLPILMVCPDGLHFNPILSVCDWPQNANCNINSEPTTTSTGNPKPKPTAILNF